MQYPYTNTFGNQMPYYGGGYQPSNQVPRYEPVMQNQNYIQPKPLYLVGKTINSAEEVSPGEIPMDGSTVFYPFVDGTKLLAKSWNSDGTIETSTYVLSSDISPNNDSDVTPSNDFYNAIDKRLASIENLLKPLCDDSVKE